MKKITNKQLNQLVVELNEYKPQQVSVKVGESTLEVEIKPILTVDEFSSYVRSVVDAVFNDNEYRADVLSYAIKKATIAFYTNLGSEFNNKVLNALIYSSDLFDIIGSVINMEQHNRIEAAVYDAINNKQRLIYANHQYGTEQIKNAMIIEQDELVTGIESLMKQIKEVSLKFNPEIQKTSLDFMKHINDMDEKTLANNIIAFNQANKSGDVSE